MKKILLISLIFLISLFSINVLNANAASWVTAIPSATIVEDSSIIIYDSNLSASGTGTNAGYADVALPVTLLTFTVTSSAGVTCSIVNNVELKIVPTPSFTGTTSCTVKATDAASSIDNTFSITVNPILSLSGLTSADKLTIIGQVDQSKSKIFSINNVGTLTLSTTITMPAGGNFTDNDEDQITFSLTPTSPFNVAASGSTDVTLAANVPEDMDLGIYTGTVTVTAGSKTKTFTLEVKIEPEICKDGRVSNSNPINSASDGNLRVDINDPDSGDNFGPGEDIKISLNVENNKDDDLDVIVEATLYNIDKNNGIVSVESDSVTIESDNDEDFDLTLNVPFDDSDLKEGNDYVLYVKAYEDGNEDENCNYDSIDLDFERNTHDVAITDVTITPSVAACSETVNFAVDVQNIGTKDEDNVQIKLRESTLGLDLSSEIFSLKKFDKSGDSALKTFTFKIPDNAKEGDYYVDAKVFFTSKSNTLSLNKLTVANCKAVTSQDVLTLPQTSFTSTQGKVFTVPLTLKNPGTQTATYTVDIDADNNWADVSAEQKVSVAAGEQTTLYAYLTPKPSLAQGTYAATINVKQDDKLVKTASITASVGTPTTVTGGAVYQPSVTFDSIWRNLAQSTAFWIAAVVIIFALIIYVLSALLRPK